MYEQLDRVTLAFGVADTSISKGIKESLVSKKACPLAVVKYAKIYVPNFTAAVTATLQIKDAEGHVLFSKAAIAKNGATAIGTDELKDVPVQDSSKITVVLTGAPVSAGSVYVDLYVYRD